MYLFREKQFKNMNLYISTMKDYVKRAIDNYRMKHREKYLEYQKAYKRTEAYKERNRDVRMKQFKIFCRMAI